MVTKNKFSPPQQFVFGAVLFVVFIIMTTIYTYFYLTGRAKAASYASALQCSSEQQANAANCRRLANASVEQVFTARAGRAQEHLAQFQLPEGTRFEVKIPNQEFWQHLQKGEQVTTEVWRGQVTRVKTANGEDEPTGENPEWNSPRVSDGILPVAATFGILAMLFMITALFRWKKSQKF